MVSGFTKSHFRTITKLPIYLPWDRNRMEWPGLSFKHRGDAYWKDTKKRRLRPSHLLWFWYKIPNRCKLRKKNLFITEARKFENTKKRLKISCFLSFVFSWLAFYFFTINPTSHYPSPIFPLFQSSIIPILIIRLGLNLTCGYPQLSGYLSNS